MKYKILIALSLTFLLASCGGWQYNYGWYDDTEKACLVVGNDSNNIITEVSIKKQNGTRYRIIFGGIIKKNVEQIIVIPEGNYFVRVGVVDPSTFDYTYYVTSTAALFEKAKMKTVYFNGSEINFE